MTTAYDVAAIRADFPILAQDIRGQSLVYLDSAASAQKPRQVIDCVSGVYETGYANVHRGLHYLSEKATADYEGAREKIRAFMNAESSAEIIYTRGASEAINLVAASWGGANIGPGDEIVISEAEHHSNIVPWQILRDQKGAVLKVLPVDDEGAVHLDQFRG